MTASEQAVCKIRVNTVAPEAAAEKFRTVDLIET